MVNIIILREPIFIKLFLLFFSKVSVYFETDKKTRLRVWRVQALIQLSRSIGNSQENSFEIAQNQPYQGVTYLAFLYCW